MRFDRNELSQMSLQRLSYVLPQDMDEEILLKEIFEQRASVSTYQTLTSVDVKIGWQEGIIQKHVDIKRETMAPENAAELSGEDQAALDASVVTKEKELELQAKLDAKNGKKKPVIEATNTATITANTTDSGVAMGTTVSTDSITLASTEGGVGSEEITVPVETKKKGRPAKNK